jgi:flavin reductase (DIM6/NTAB) family NADH-FMN oxidoreductase RutF
VTIHASDPFASPEESRSQVRRMRGRLPAAVTLWTAYDHDGRPAGLTISSTMVVDGSPGHVLGLVDDESSLWAAVTRTGVFAVMPLRSSDDRLADVLAGLMPEPGGAFAGREWERTPYGPVLPSASAWAGCQLSGHRQLGYGLLVEATIAQVELRGDGDPPLIHYRGRYLRGLPPTGE